MYTPEFKPLYERYFLPSIQDDLELVVREYPQECPSGLFLSPGWDKTMLRKLELLHEAIEEHWGDQIFFYSDIDIIFLKPMVETALRYLGDNDFVVQRGWPRHGICAGFFVMRGNEKTLKLITIAHQLLEENLCIDDQVAIQTALTKFKRGEIRWKLLPSKQFPNGSRVLTEGAKIVLDDSIVLFHANCTIGLENKYQFLTRVQEEYLKKGIL